MKIKTFEIAIYSRLKYNFFMININADNYNS